MTVKYDTEFVKMLAESPNHPLTVKELAQLLLDANAKNDKLKHEIEVQKEDLWAQINVFKDHNSYLFRQSGAALDALKKIAAIPPTGEATLMKVQNIADEAVYLAKQAKAEPSGKCPACKCEHQFTTIKSHGTDPDDEGPCSICGQGQP